MRARAALFACMMSAVVMAGCATDDEADTDDADTLRVDGKTLATLPGYQGLPVDLTPVFSTPLLVDGTRAGGEPVIAITPEGTILISAHPGWTHYHPSEDPAHPGAEIATPANVQSYLWRSTDGGATWNHVNLQAQGTEVPVDNLPRSTALGVSDPDFTVMEDGTVCMTDLFALASSSVSCSEDDGLTWLPGNLVASGYPNDRQWLWSDGEELYFSANFLGAPPGVGSRHVRASEDKGLTWEERGNRPCNQDPVAVNGTMYQACDNGLAISTDGGMSFTKVREVPNSTGGNRMAEPGVDADGNVWIAWAEGERRLWVAGTPDQGETWPWVHEITPHFRLHSQNTELDHSEFGGTTTYGPETPRNGSYIWPWISAGSGGRIAVTWIGGFSETDSATYSDPWFLFTAYVLNATTATPTVVVQEMTPHPIHFGPICQGGTGCQVSSMQGSDSGDRRLGDFFETTIDADGYLHATVSDTWSQRDDVISHPLYVRQEGGVRLVSDEDRAQGWMPTQG